MEEAARHSLRWRCSVRTAAHTAAIRLSQPSPSWLFECWADSLGRRPQATDLDGRSPSSPCCGPRKSVPVTKTGSCVTKILPVVTKIQILGYKISVAFSLVNQHLLLLLLPL